LMQAAVTDLEDGLLPDTSVTWYSSVDGALSNGTTANVYGPLVSDLPLSLGWHTIEVRAVDSAGAQSGAFVSIEIVSL